MSESVEKQIQRLNQELASLKEERRGLSLEAKKWAEERDTIHKKIGDLRTRIADLREKRDNLNERVKELKNLRDQTRTTRKKKQPQILELKGELRRLVDRKPSQSMQNVQKEIEKIEWKIQTTSLPVKEEEELISRVKQLEVQLSVHKRIKKSREKLITLRTEEKGLDERAKAYHEEMSELVEPSQKFHEDMLENLKKVRDLRVDADIAHQKYVKTRKQAQNLRQECVELADRVRALERGIREEEEKKQARLQRQLLEELEERALKKLERGDKLTWEEFKLLAEKGRL